VLHEGERTENTRKADAIAGRVIEIKNRKRDVDNESVVELDRKSGRNAIKNRDQISTKPGSKLRTPGCDIIDDDDDGDDGDDDDGVGTGADSDETNT